MEEYHPSTALTLRLGSSTNHCSISTALTMCDPSWNYNINKINSVELGAAAHKHEKLSAKNMQRNQDESVMAVSSVSTELSLQSKDPSNWKIRKRLTESDLGKLSRLLIPKGDVRDHVLRYLDDKFTERVMSKEGLGVIVRDCDTNTVHQLTFKYWSTTQCYILNGEWRQTFVHRRGLKKNDEIGLYWDTSRFMFMFSLRRRASQSHLPNLNLVV